MPRSDVYIALIECSAVVAVKIEQLHQVTFFEVQEAVQWPATPVRAVWVEDERGPRLAVTGLSNHGRTIKALLYPVDDDDGVWRLGTALCLD